MPDSAVHLADGGGRGGAGRSRAWGPGIPDGRPGHEAPLHLPRHPAPVVARGTSALAGDVGANAARNVVAWRAATARRRLLVHREPQLVLLPGPRRGGRGRTGPGPKISLSATKDIAATRAG